MIGTIKILAPEPGIKIGPGESGVPKNPPTGFGPLVHSPEGLETLAKGLLSQDYGTRAIFQDKGFSYMARIEPHRPDPARNLLQWHKGVTVYESKTSENIWPLIAIFAGVSAIGYTLSSLLWR